jgi:hypothetical protein
VVGPGQKATQCVAFSAVGIGEIEFPEVLEIREGETHAEFGGEVFGERPEKTFPIGSLGRITLFLLHDAATDLPIRPQPWRN